MDANQIKALIASIEAELPFTPPFQYKKFGEDPYPLNFSENVTYLGDWSAHCLRPYSKIEWFCIRPQYLKRVGKLVPPKVISCESDFISLLHKLKVSFVFQGDSILIHCNKNN
ncbi:DUF6678 family protein [Thalassotalea agarivorans]|uniref:Uncharacterized protein n=1 Tax=Thalassotalea agarivorans TaxID=349064 RepID=A0A1I0GKG8_THASX|nr:DUF6678 family protein [Thalassotalea agarivorans]SET70545.1 hypothetical protein SAMN05660429_02442 [Thalassotalea agarivorans]